MYSWKARRLKTRDNKNRSEGGVCCVCVSLLMGEDSQLAESGLIGWNRPGGRKWVDLSESAKRLNIYIIHKVYRKRER